MGDNSESCGGGGDVENQKELRERNEDDSSENTISTSSKDPVPVSKAKDGHHAHGDEGPTTTSLVASAVVCFVIYFVFCIVFSSVVWDPLAFASSSDPTFGVPQGVGINLLGIAIGCVAFAANSGSKAVMAGPDLIPVVFFAQAGASVVAYLSSISSDPYSGCNDETTHHRILGGGGYGDSPDPCVHRRLADDEVYLDDDAKMQVVPTTLAAMMIGNAATGLLFYGLGKMKNTAAVIGFIPAAVVAGFLTCIGYKVIKLAVLITTGYNFKLKYVKYIGEDLPHANDPWVPLTIALVYGITLYALKRKHIIAAEKLILGFITVPLIMFFVITAAMGVPMEQLRQEGWFLTQQGDGSECTTGCPFTVTQFWQGWGIAYSGGRGNGVAWAALPRAIPIFIMGSVMTTLDNMLKLTSSEKALGVDLDYNHEMKLGGKATMFSSLIVGSPAYGQTKFNVMNLSIARTSTSEVPSMLLGTISVLFFFSGLAGPVINIMPRFLLGGLCVFAGVGFLYENLWEARLVMNKFSFGIVWTIFLVNFIYEFFILQLLPLGVQPMLPGLLVVFCLGLILATFEFMFAFMHAAKPPIILKGAECCSSTVRSEKHEKQLAIVARWYQVLKVDNFVFFGTANAIYQLLKSNVEHQATLPRPTRMKYFILDLHGVTGIDLTAKDVFVKVKRLLNDHGITLIWTVGGKIMRKLRRWGILKEEPFDSIDLALRYVEDGCLSRAHKLCEKWLVNNTVRSIFEQQTMATIFSLSVRSDDKSLASTRLRPWGERLNLKEDQMIFTESSQDDNLYMLYDGEVEVQSSDGSCRAVFNGSFFNLDALLISVGSLPGPPTTVCATAKKDTMVLKITKQKFRQCMREDGALAQKLLLTLIVQNENSRPGKKRALWKTDRETSMIKLDTVPFVGSIASRLLLGDDYIIDLTPSQIENFSTIYDIIAADGGGEEIPMTSFADHVKQEARAQGSTLDPEQFNLLIEKSGIDEDGDGSLSKDEFLNFLRGLIIAAIPAKEVDTLKIAYDNALAEHPEGPMDEVRIKALFNNLGFDVKHPGIHAVLGSVDADGDGEVDFDEFMAGVGMMKKLLAQSHDLDNAFLEYKGRATILRRSLVITESASRGTNKGRRRATLTKRLSSLFTAKATAVSHQEESDEVGRGNTQQDISDNDGNDVRKLELEVPDLVAFLKITPEEAEEMIFLADEDDGDDAGTIDRAEFQQLLKTWA